MLPGPTIAAVSLLMIATSTRRRWNTVPEQSNAALTVSPGPNGMAAHSERGMTAVKQAPGHRQVKGVRRDRFVGGRGGEGDLPVRYVPSAHVPPIPSLRCKLSAERAVGPRIVSHLTGHPSELLHTGGAWRTSSAPAAYAARRRPYMHDLCEVMSVAGWSTRVRLGGVAPAIRTATQALSRTLGYRVPGQAPPRSYS